MPNLEIKRHRKRRRHSGFLSVGKNDERHTRKFPPKKPELVCSSKTSVTNKRVKAPLLTMEALQFNTYPLNTRPLAKETSSQLSAGNMKETLVISVNLNYIHHGHI
jgi:hypothetical protein